MDYITQFRKQIAIRSFAMSLFPVLFTLLAVTVSLFIFEFDRQMVVLISGFVGIFSGLFASFLMLQVAAKPVETLTNIILYAAHSNRSESAPDTEHLSVAKEIVQALAREIYSLASEPQVPTISDQPVSNVVSESSPQLLDGIGIPIIGIDESQKITVANKAAAAYVGKELPQLIGQQLYDVLSFSFTDDNTFELWLKQSKQSSVTATQVWERVKHITGQDTSKQFDLVASFSSGSSSGAETMLALFDRTERYGKDDQEINFVALAVHELRTPLTVMRGYIEVFEDELGPTLSPELADFMHKMHASAQQLAAFVGNILNVVRVDENQLALKLRSEDWAAVLKNAVNDLQLQAKVHGKTIELHIAEELPPVAADRISAHEVINNLVDNAIKYSGKADKIVITAQVNSDGVVETSVQDFGMGIPASVMPELFLKFHRSHKSSVQVGGTGLGLYLCKALVAAHGGNIWVRSKEGEGSIFSFTLLPYDQVASEQTSNEDGIIRGAHGWIKNHSLYRN